ncbi:MAG: oligosaccharide flippase family protein, partial [Thermoleophilaceae bacterium]
AHGRAAHGPGCLGVSSPEPAAGESVVRRVAQNTAAQALGKVTVLAIGAVSIVVTTRYLGASGYGQLALALTFVQMLGLLADLGLLTVVVREISRDPDATERLVGNALTLRLALSVVVIALAGLLGLAMPYTPEVRVAILIAGVPLVLGLANTAIVAVFQARLRMDRAAISDVAGRSAGFAALVVVAALDLGFYAVVATAAVGAFVTLVVTWRLSRPLVRVRPQASRPVWRSLLAAALPVGAALAVTEVYFRADTLIVSLFEPYAEVGFYALGYRVIELLGMLPAVVMTSVFPLLARYLRDDRDLARSTIDAAADLFVALGVPLAAGGLVVAPQLVRLIGGDDFEGAANTLRILLFAGAMAFVSGLFGMALIAGDRQRSALLLGLAALAFNVPVNFALVPSLGIDAAAAVAVASELLLVVGGVLLVRRELGIVPRMRMLWRSLAAATGMAGILALVNDWSLALLVPLGMAIYAAGLWAVGGIDRRMLEALRA